jgi:hypothetical protein
MHFLSDSHISNQSPISPVRQINHALKDSTTLTETVCNSSWELLWSSSQLSPNISSNAVTLVCPYFAWAAAALSPCYEPLKLPSLWMSIFCLEESILACQRRVFRPSQHDTLATQLPHHVGKKSREQSHTTLPLTQRSDTRFLVLVHHLLGWILHAPSYRIDSQSEWSVCVVPSWMRCCDPQGREAASSDESGHVDLLLVRRMIVRWRCRPGWILPHG